MHELIVTTPRRPSDSVLHVRGGCRMGRAHWRTVASVGAAEGPHAGLPPRCLECEPRLTEARAQLWLGHLAHEAHDARSRREAAARSTRRVARQNAWQAQFESLRAATEAAWSQPVEFNTYTGPGRFALMLGHPDWRDVGSIYLDAEDGGDHVVVAGMNFSTALIGSPDRAHALSAVFRVIENWRTSRLDMPADAPGFYLTD